MAKRFSLREFQQKIIERIQQKEVAGDRISTLGVQVGGDYWLVDMHEISEVLPMPEITPVHLTQPWYCGIANVRGNLYSIADLAAFMGQGKTPAGLQTRVLLVSPRFSCNAGLVVARVLGLRDARTWKYEVQEGEIRYQDDQGQTWRKLEVAQLLLQPDFLQIGI